MACCGQKREALGQALTATRSTNVQAVPTRTPTRSTSFADSPPPAPVMTPRPAAALASVPFGAVGLRYLARSPIIVRGPTSGIEYRFSAAQPVQRVARSDCATLLRTGHFSMA